MRSQKSPKKDYRSLWRTNDKMDLLKILKFYEKIEKYDMKRNNLLIGCFRVCLVTGPLTGWPNKDLKN